jgi:predicted phage tail protein
VLVRDAAVTDHERELHMQHGPEAEFTLAPILAGSKSKWAGIILGAALIAFAMTNPFGWAAMPFLGSNLGVVAFGMGASLVLGGIAQLLAPTPKAADPSDKPSYLFNGPVQTSQQGYPVPVGYGELIVGGAVISAGSWSEDLPK